MLFGVLSFKPLSRLNLNYVQLTDTRPVSNVHQRTRPLAPPPQVLTRPNPFTNNRPDCARSDPRSKVARLAPAH
ncbi:hypothetical protein J6590_040604 [Homalodisca vitripennis]|nr:hypothetical protein J6590_040604 [Homalodisca vitripennis]